MEREDILEKLAEQYGVSKDCLLAIWNTKKPEHGVSPLELIDKGAVLTDYAGYFKLQDGTYEPSEWIKIPVGYAKRGEISVDKEQ